MPFLARLLLSLSCLLAVASPATAADMHAMAAADMPAQHCQHAIPADHDDHAAGMTSSAQGVCDDCSACTSHCTPVMIAVPGRLPLASGSVQIGAVARLLAGITAVPELKPPRG